jgi:ribosomal protein L29
MRAEKMRGIDATDLQRQAQDAQEQLFRFRFQMGMGQAEGLKKYRVLKKDRARMLTVLHEKAAKGEVPEVPAAKPVKKVAAGKKSPADKKKSK